MRVPVLAAAVVLAGCEQSPGLQLEVGVTDTSIRRIELIVGADCDNCPTTMAAPNVKPRETLIFSSPHPEAWFVDVDGAFAGFVLHGDGDADQRIPVLGIVGYDAAQTPIAYARMADLLVPAHDELYTRVELKPLIPIDASVPTDDRERVAVWRHSEQREPSCMMVEHWSSGMRTTSAIVPPSDPDCDHVLFGECAPYVPNAMNVQSSLSNGNCMLPAAFPAAAVCVIGGPSCTDGVPQTADLCARLDEDHCLPSALCACAPAEPVCLFDALTTGTSDGSVTAFHCTVPVTASGALCDGPTATPLDGAQFLAPGTTCKAIRFLAPFLRDMNLRDSVPFKSDAKLTLASFRTPCAIDLEWEGTAPNVAVDPYDVAFVDLELDNQRHIDVPVRITTVANCGESFRCQLVPASNDAVFLCGGAM